MPFMQTKITPKDTGPVHTSSCPCQNAHFHATGKKMACILYAYSVTGAMVTNSLSDGCTNDYVFVFK